MNKDEILKKSRSEHSDEREDAIRDRSLRWTLITMTVLSVVFAFLRAYKGQSTSDLAVVMCGSVGVTFLYRFFRTKQIYYLVLAAVLLAVAVFSLIRFISGY